MTYSNAYTFSDDNYTGIYCQDCAETAAKAHALTYIENAGGSLEVLLRELTDYTPRWLDDSDCSDRGEYCEECTTEVCPPYYECEGCGRCGWAEEGFEAALTEGAEADDNGQRDRPMTRWCEYCEDENRTPGSTLLEDDGRGYRLRFLPDYEGRPTYSAGCRRFTLEEALQHWGPTHCTHGYPMWRDDSPADRLFGAVLRHAMKRALPNLNV